MRNINIIVCNLILIDLKKLTGSLIFLPPEQRQKNGKWNFQQYFTFQFHVKHHAIQHINNKPYYSHFNTISVIQQLKAAENFFSSSKQLTSFSSQSSSLVLLLMPVLAFPLLHTHSCYAKVSWCEILFVRCVYVCACLCAFYTTVNTLIRCNFKIINSGG